MRIQAHNIQVDLFLRKRCIPVCPCYENIAALLPAAGTGSLCNMKLRSQRKKNIGLFSALLSLLHLTGQRPHNTILSPAQIEAFEKVLCH